MQGTNFSSITVKTKKLNSKFDYFLVVQHVLLGYADLISDCFAVVELFNSGRPEIAGLNISFLVLNVLLDIYSSYKKKSWDIFIRIFQLSDLVEGLKTLTDGKQTEGFVASKRVDAVCRSLPSMILQLFTLLLDISTIDRTGYSILMISISLSAVGMATMLASLSPKSGMHFFSSEMFIISLYYLSEVLLRVLVVVIIFISVRGIGFVVISIDFLLRCGFLLASNKFDFALSLMWLGSDNAMEKEDFWLLGSVGNIVLLFIFLIIINVLKTDDLNAMRQDYVVRDVTIVSCLALFAKTVLYNIVKEMEVKRDEGMEKSMTDNMNVL
jgi:hypothetical protein